MIVSAIKPIIQDLITKQTRIIDFGCGSGWFFQEFGDRIGEGIGIDYDKSLAERAANRNQFSNVKYIHADAKDGLPIEPGSIDMIVAFGVLEHVGPERPYIIEFNRLLRPGGKLIISVPSNGPFRAIDIGNIKYNFPKLHKWFYYYIARRRRHYDEKFGAGAAMFGQFSHEATRHKHYSDRELVDLTAPWFVMERHFHYGLFFELIQFLEVIICRPLGRKGHRLFSWFLKQDCKILSPLGRACFLGIFRKQ